MAIGYTGNSPERFTVEKLRFASSFTLASESFDLGWNCGTLINPDGSGATGELNSGSGMLLRPPGGQSYEISDINCPDTQCGSEQHFNVDHSCAALILIDLS